MKEKIILLMETLNQHEVGCKLEHDNDNREFYLNLNMCESNPHRLYTNGKLVKRTTEYEINLNNNVDLILHDLTQEFEDMLRYSKVGINENWVKLMNKML